jgi:hypothetical protein
MSGDRPTDYNEDAFFAALLVMVKTAIGAGMDRTVLAAQLQEVAAAARVDKCFGKADALDIVAEAADLKKRRSAKPVLDVIQGGKGE